MSERLKVKYFAPSGNEIETTFPGKLEVCSGCGGRGTELSGGLKGAVFTGEDFANDPEFAEDYFGGKYDTTCSVCRGQNVEIVIDYDNLSVREQHHAILYTAHLQVESDADLDAYYERRAMGYAE